MGARSSGLTLQATERKPQQPPGAARLRCPTDEIKRGLLLGERVGVPKFCPSVCPFSLEAELLGLQETLGEVEWVLGSRVTGVAGGWGEAGVLCMCLWGLPFGTPLAMLMLLPGNPEMQFPSSLKTVSQAQQSALQLGKWRPREGRGPAHDHQQSGREVDNNTTNNKGKHTHGCRHMHHCDRLLEEWPQRVRVSLTRAHGWSRPAQNLGLSM